MNIDDDASIKELEALKKKIDKKIEAKKSSKVDQSALYEMIKKDHERHRREDGRKVFRGVVDYLECYVNGLPPIAKASFCERLGSRASVARSLPKWFPKSKDFCPRANPSRRFPRSPGFHQRVVTK